VDREAASRHHHHDDGGAVTVTLTADEATRLAQFLAKVARPRGGDQETELEWWLDRLAGRTARWG
jgi:hypothetical protein